MILLDDRTLNQFASDVSVAALQLPHAARGRQNDRGAQLTGAGVLVIPLFTDPGVPGAVYSADLVELKAGRLGVHRVETIRDGVAGNNVNVPVASVVPASAILQLLAGHLVPGVLPTVLAGGDPLSILAQLIRSRRVEKE